MVRSNKRRVQSVETEDMSKSDRTHQPQKKKATSKGSRAKLACICAPSKKQAQISKCIFLYLFKPCTTLYIDEEQARRKSGWCDRLIREYKQLVGGQQSQ